MKIKMHLVILGFLALGMGLYADFNPAQMYYNNGNFGLGTEQPQSYLHLKSASPFLTFESTSGSSTNKSGLHFMNPNALGKPMAWQLLYTPSTQTFEVYNGAQNRSAQTFNSDGTVAFGERARAAHLVTVGSPGLWVNAQSGSSGITAYRSDELYFNVNMDSATAYLSSGATQGMVFQQGTTERIRIASNGNVGIGTSTPQTMLHVNGILTATRFAGDGSGLTNLPSVNSQWITGENGLISYMTGKVMVGERPREGQNYLVTVGGPGLWVNAQSGSNGITAYRADTLYFNVNMDGTNVYLSSAASQPIVVQQGSTPRLKITSNGDVEVSKDLTVIGKLNAKDIVTYPTKWADYVFEPSYSLMPIEKLEKFIKANKHLPGVPSESEIKAGGVNVTEMQVVMLQKIEEMSLYIIQLQKEINQLKAAQGAR